MSAALPTTSLPWKVRGWVGMTAMRASSPPVRVSQPKYGATALVPEAYGGELLAFLHAIARDAATADDAWSVLAAAIWRSLGGFAGRWSLRTCL